MQRPHYINKNGKRIELEISHHAFLRLKERWHQLYDSPEPEDLQSFIAERFAHANKVVNHSKVERERLKKYGSDTLYFRHNDFTFVVQNAVIVTIEISNSGQRHLNKSHWPDIGTSETSLDK